MDFDTVADDLYGLPPKRFTAARDRYAARARDTGDKELAARIGALRRPTLAAWAGNLLVRHRPDDVRALAALGEELRRAHRQLDGAQLHELTRRQRDLVDALAREARRLATAAGAPIGDTAQGEVEATLHALLGDPAAARDFAGGRLTTAFPPPAGFPAADDTAIRRPPRPGGRQETVVPLETARERRRQRERDERRAAGERRAREEREARERELTDRRNEAEDAERELAEARRETAGLAARLDRARSREREAEDRARRAHARLRDAQQAAPDRGSEE
ncbi:hypothetical protein AB0K09_11665 [Streptomyces sp. NPDC049577]|uniref:hypothetical protein n=1 Tax=Streptomyces sp. NPDC049577 TaxID=3155153 RepID=UPI00343D88BE